MNTSIVGSTFDDYTITELIGKGNMGEVYLARQNSLQREVALKILRRTNSSDSNDFISRFLREARMAASIQHPNVVNIYAIGNKEAFCYIAMEYVAGDPLEALIECSPLSEEDTWLMALQISDALKAALMQDIIHRDIKPANILMADGQAKVTDFGLSKRKGDQEITQAGLILGTPSYMSIEQASGEHIVDHRSDIYSLGATIYKTITGSLMFSANTVIDVLYKHKYEKTVDPIERVPSLSYKSSFIIAKMIQKDPGHRYQNYDEILCDVHSLLDDKPLVYASERHASMIYRDKPAEQRVFSKTSRLTQRIVGNVQNIIKRDEAAESRKKQTRKLIKSKTDEMQETKRRSSQLTSELTAIRRRKRTTKREGHLLQNNIEFLEERLGKSFSDYLVEKGVLTREQLEFALEIYLNVNSKFGELAVSEGWLLPDQVQKILKVQKRIKKSFGQLAIQMGFLTKQQVLEILAKQDRHHIDFYQVLLREKIIARHLLEQELILFAKMK